MFNSFVDTIHNIFSLGFFFQVLYLSFNIISTDQTNTEYIINQYDSIYFYSSIFFFVSGIINILDRSYLFILHHIISWISLYYGYIYKNPKYIYWMCQNFISEISSIFLSIDYIVKNIWEKNKYNYIIKIFFLISYTLVRIIYLLPININFLLTNEFEDNYKYFLPLAFSFMIGLNIYWFILIIKKFFNFLFYKKE
jgi:hypothetical protein